MTCPLGVVSTHAALRVALRCVAREIANDRNTLCMPTGHFTVSTFPSKCEQELSYVEIVLVTTQLHKKTVS